MAEGSTVPTVPKTLRGTRRRHDDSTAVSSPCDAQTVPTMNLLGTVLRAASVPAAVIATDPVVRRDGREFRSKFRTNNGHKPPKLAP
jgi:hypothetical protein